MFNWCIGVWVDVLRYVKSIIGKFYNQISKQSVILFEHNTCSFILS